MNVVVHNLMAQNANRQLGITTKGKSKSAEKLSSGYRINRAADDAAGLTISEKMRYQIRGLGKASGNLQDAVSFVHVADGALEEVQSMLQRMNELCIQGANDTNTDEDRDAIQMELDEIQNETERIFNQTEFNTIPVFRRKIGWTQYVDNTQQVVVKTGGDYVKGNNYGLVSVMGEANITTDSHLADRVTFSGSGWVSSGSRDASVDLNSYYSWLYDNTGKKQNRVGTSSSTTISRGATDWSNVNFTNAISGGTWSGYTANGNVLSKTMSTTELANYGITSLYDKNGNSVSVANIRAVDKISINDYGDGNKYASSREISYYDSRTGEALGKDQYLVRNYDGSGGSYRDGGTYACASMDFGKMGTDFDKDDLVGLGFTSQCSHGCRQYYSVEFVDNSNNSYTLNKTTSNGLAYTQKMGQSYLIQIDISGLSNNASGGQQLVAAIVDAANNWSTFEGHWEQYAYNTSDPGKLYLYENTLSTRSGERSTWEPAARTEQGVLTVDYSTDGGTVRWKQEQDLKIQATYKGLQAIELDRPVMTNNDLGISGISVKNAEEASESIEIAQSAMAYVSSKRSDLGALNNRFEFAKSIADNTMENTQSAESKIRDTDMATEMVNYSKHNILEQAGQSILAQANQQPQGILSLLQ